jgi:hypothetical protein
MARRFAELVALHSPRASVERRNMCVGFEPPLDQNRLIRKDMSDSVGLALEQTKPFISELEEFFETRVWGRKKAGGESGIRTLRGPLESVTYRFHNAGVAVDASDAVAPCPPLPAVGTVESASASSDALE